jgi:hypothetical protein
MTTTSTAKTVAKTTAAAAKVVKRTSRWDIHVEKRSRDGDGSTTFLNTSPSPCVRDATGERVIP